MNVFLFTALGPLLGLAGLFTSLGWIFWVGVALCAITLWFNLASGAMKFPVLPIVFMVVGTGFSVHWYVGIAGGLILWTALESVGEISGFIWRYIHRIQAEKASTKGIHIGNKKTQITTKVIQPRREQEYVDSTVSERLFDTSTPGKDTHLKIKHSEEALRAGGGFDAVTSYVKIPTTYAVPISSQGKSYSIHFGKKDVNASLPNLQARSITQEVPTAKVPVGQHDAIPVAEIGSQTERGDSGTATSPRSKSAEDNRGRVFDNKLTISKAHYVMPTLPSELANDEGIIPWNIVIDPNVGTETCLLLLDRTPFIHTLAKVRPFDLRLKSGLIRTAHGPFFFLLFYVPDPNRPGTEFVAIDAHVNPYDPKHMTLWRDLARQSHWHLILLGADDKLVDLFEFPNTFELGKTLDQVEAVCEKLPHGSFDEAKAEFCARYTIDDLMRLQ